MLASRFLEESHGPSGRLDLVGAALATVGLAGIVWGVVRGNDLGWTSPQVVGAARRRRGRRWPRSCSGRRRVAAPMLPLRLFRSRAFTATNLVSLAMYFGTFGSIFLLAQFLQTVQGYSAFEAGVRTLPWTIMPMFVAPIAGALSDRIGGRPLMAAGPRPAGDRAGLARVDHHRRRRLLAASSCRSSSPAPAWRWCSRRSRTS